MINKIKSLLVDNCYYIIGYFVSILVFGCFIYSFTNNYLSIILSFLVVDVLLGHFFESKIEYNKLVLSHTKNNKQHLFNSDYYDLYWNYNIMMIRLTFGLFTTLVYLVNSLIELELIYLFTIATGCLLLAILFVGIVCMEFGHYKKIRKLIYKRKQEFYFEFDSDDMEIINKYK
jgi:hypothetical protein